MAPPAEPTAPVKATCHCGAVTIHMPRKPDEINECQCTLCRRYAAAWGYYTEQEVKISVTETTPTRQYIWGDRDLEFHFCSVCGCVTHWRSIENGTKMGVNTRLMEPDEVRRVSRRVSFGILSQPLRSKETAHAEDKAQY